MRRLQPGIYCLTNHANRKRLIGASKYALGRIRDHFRALANDEHENPALQAAYDMDGASCWSAKVVEYLTDEMVIQNDKALSQWLDAREDYWMKKYKTIDPKYGYNICGPSGSRRGAKWSEQSKAAIKARWKNGEFTVSKQFIAAGKRNAAKLKGKKRPGVSEKVSATWKARVSALTPEAHAKLGATATANLIKGNAVEKSHSPESKEKRRKTFKTRRGTYKKYSAAIAKQWANPSFRKRVGNAIAQGQVRAWQDPAKRENRTKGIRKAWRDASPKRRAQSATNIKMANALFEKEPWRKKARAAKAAETNRKIWADPRKRAAHSRRMKAIAAKRAVITS